MGLAQLRSSSAQKTPAPRRDVTSNAPGQERRGRQEARSKKRSWGTTSSSSAAQSGCLRAPACYARLDAAPRHTGTRCGAPHGRVACRQVQGIIPTTSLEIASPEAPAACSLERPPRVSRRGEMAEVHGTGCMDRLACFEFDEDPGD